MGESRLARELPAPVACLQSGRTEVRQRIKEVLNLLRYRADPVRGNDVALELSSGKRVDNGRAIWDEVRV